MTEAEIRADQTARIVRGIKDVAGSWPRDRPLIMAVADYVAAEFAAGKPTFEYRVLLSDADAAPDVGLPTADFASAQAEMHQGLRESDPAYDHGEVERRIAAGKWRPFYPPPGP